jgi:hypothetical protein
MVADRFIDYIAVAIGRACHNGQILFLHLPCLELRGDRIMRLIALCDDDHTARVAIKPMNDARASWAAATAERTEVMR